MSSIWYATIEQVSASLEIFNTARANPIIAAKLGAATQSVEGSLHRRFYPEIRTISVDWPSYSLSPSWEIQLGDNELISKSGLVVTSGGVTISNSDIILRRADDRAEPPYNILQINLSSNAALSAGLTFQQSLSITGPFGFNDTDTSLPACGLGSNISDSATSLVLYPLDGLFNVGIGSIILIGTERLVLTARRMSHSTVTTAGTLAAQQNAVSLAVSDGTNFAIGETILIESERMRIVDIAGNTLTVDRAWDGSVLASHASGLGIYALRTFTTRRGQLGTTAAAHTTADTVYVHDFAERVPLVNELCIAETVTLLEQNAAGYARVIGSGASTREAKAEGLADVRDRAYIAFGRKLRSGAI